MTLWSWIASGVLAVIGGFCWSRLTKARPDDAVPMHNDRRRAIIAAERENEARS